MAEIRSLPGEGCRFYALGRCLYEESLNPGYHERFRCAALAGIEDEYDGFLERAEAFRLDMKTAGSVWEKRFARLARQGIHCPFDLLKTTGAFYECPNYLEGLCLAALPPCPGRCKRFARFENKGTP